MFGGIKVGPGRVRRVFKKSLIYFTILLVLVLFYLGLHSEREIPASYLENKGFLLYNASYEGWDEAKRLWVVEAEQIWQAKDGRNLFFQGIKKFQFFQEDERSFSLHANEAKMEFKKELLTIYEVSGFMVEGEFTTKEVKINTKTKQVLCENRIIFQKEGLKVEADRMEGDLNAEEYLFSGNLKVKQKNNYSRGKTFRYFAKEDCFEIQGEVEVELEL